MVYIFAAATIFLLYVMYVEYSALNSAFKETILWNIEAKGLCADHRETKDRQETQKEILLYLTQEGNRPCLTLVEVNKSFAMDFTFLEKLKQLGYRSVFASKDSYAPPPTRDDPDGVLFLYPLEKFKGLTIEAMPHAVAEFHEKSKLKKAGAPWIRVSNSFGFFVALTHLKSKTNCSQVRVDQLKKMGVLTKNGKPSFWLTGLIGDLNEDFGTSDETLVTDALVKSGMNRNIEEWPKTNMKESKVLADAIYANDSRQVGSTGACYSTTDWVFFKGGVVTGMCLDELHEPDEWYKNYLSDHRPVVVKIG